MALGPGDFLERLEKVFFFFFASPLKSTSIFVTTNCRSLRWTSWWCWFAFVSCRARNELRPLAWRFRQAYSRHEIFTKLHQFGDLDKLPSLLPSTRSTNKRGRTGAGQLLFWGIIIPASSLQQCHLLYHISVPLTVPFHHSCIDRRLLPLKCCLETFSERKMNRSEPFVNISPFFCFCFYISPFWENSYP